MTMSIWKIHAKNPAKQQISKSGMDEWYDKETEQHTEEQNKTNSHKKKDLSNKNNKIEIIIIASMAHTTTTIQHANRNKERKFFQKEITTNEQKKSHLNRTIKVICVCSLYFPICFRRRCRRRSTSKLDISEENKNYKLLLFEHLSIMHSMYSQLAELRVRIFYASIFTGKTTWRARLLHTHTHTL